MLATGDINWTRPVNWQHPLNRGLVSWWLAAPSPLAGFGSNRWRDLCKRNDGTLTNMDPSTDWVGSGYLQGVGALQLDGTNDLVAVPDHASLRPQTGDMSWLITVTNQAAFNNNDDLLADRPLGAVGAAQGMYLGKGGDPTSGILEVMVEASDGSAKVYEYNNGFVVGETAQLLATLSNSQNRVRIFKNGQLLSVSAAVQDDNITGKTFNSTQTFTIGGRPGTTDRCWACTVYEVRIWNREVQPTEAAAYYDLSRRRHPGLLNRIWTPRVSVQEAAATGSPWYYHLQQQLACYQQENY